MSKYLWAVGQLVNDPSSSLLSTLPYYLCKKETMSNDENASNEIPSKKLNQLPPDLNKSSHLLTNNKSSIILSNASCSGGQSQVIKRHSKRTQIGSGIVKQHQVAIQCRGSFCSKSCKTTSIHQVHLLDRSTDATFPANKMETGTNPMNKKVCLEHRQVLGILKNWFITENLQKEEANTIIAMFKANFAAIVNNLKLEKIPNIPEYSCYSKQVIKLYRSASVELITNDSMINIKRKAPKKKVNQRKDLKV